MTINVIVDNNSINVKEINFSDGGSNIRIDFPDAIEETISVSITNIPVDSYVYVIMLVSRIITEKLISINKVGKIKSTLMLPYFPHGRADRKFENGMTTPRDLITDVIKDSVFSEVITYDLHSELDDNQVGNIIYTNVEQHKLLYNMMCNVFMWQPQSILSSEFVLISPDKGAVSKIKALEQYLISNKDKKYQYTVFCDKIRNPENGWIIGTNVNGDVKDKNCVIVDDICDGGKTFIKLAEELKNRGANKILLYVTHGIFSKGLNVFASNIDEIYCSQIIGNYVAKNDLTTYNMRNL